MALRENLKKEKTNNFSELNNMSQYSYIDSTKQSQISRLKKINDGLRSSQTLLFQSNKNENDSSNSINDGVRLTRLDDNYFLNQYQLEINGLKTEIKYYQLKYDSLKLNKENKIIINSVDELKEKIQQKKNENEIIRTQNFELSNENLKIKNDIERLITVSRQKKHIKTANTTYPLSKPNKLFD